MEVKIGEKGIGLSWQDDFPKEIECDCGANAPIAFGAMENNEKKYISQLHRNEPDNFWLHDAAGFAVYLCRNGKCRKGSVLWNQG